MGKISNDKPMSFWLMGYPFERTASAKPVRTTKHQLMLQLRQEQFYNLMVPVDIQNFMLASPRGNGLVVSLRFNGSLPIAIIQSWSTTSPIKFPVSSPITTTRFEFLFYLFSDTYKAIYYSSYSESSWLIRTVELTGGSHGSSTDRFLWMTRMLSLTNAAILKDSGLVAN